MWHYNDAHRFRQPSQPGASAQSSYDLLLGMRGVSITLLFLDLSNPDNPVCQVPGFVEAVQSSSVTLGLATALPRLPAQTRFGVEVMAGPGILRFHTLAAKPPEQGSYRLEIALPRQIESIQRRKFSRAPLATAVAFSPAGETTNPYAGKNGVGQSLDLSAGGLRFMTPTQVSYGDQLFMSFNTPDGTPYRGIAAKVVRVQSDGDRYTVGVQFTDLPADLESKLVQTVFRLQLRGHAKR